MDGISPWWPVLTGFISIWLGYRIGYRQATLAAKTLALNVTKATPRIGSRVAIERRGDREHTQFFLLITLYNDGDAAASKIDGEWKFNVAHSAAPSAVKIIRMDSLPSFLPWTIEHPFGGTVNNPFFSNPNIRADVEIDLVYVGLGGSKEKYYVKYDYSAQSKTFVQSDNVKKGN